MIALNNKFRYLTNIGAVGYKTVIIIPSLTLDQEILEKISGINYYEERMLCLLMLLRMPQTHVIYITSMP
ncbi:MAG: hypothetical protein M3342_21900, partial [Bacteroidota bacterium]|nr:hypothetical protein [Bacteroidota bacterium]